MAAALCSFGKCSRRVGTQPGWQLTWETVHQIETPDILFVGLESQEVIEEQLDIAKMLSGVRVRVATFNCNRSLVLDRGLEFYDIGSSATSFTRRRSSSLRLSWAAFDDGHAQVKGSRSRPFVAEMVLSDRHYNASMHGNGRVLQAALLQPGSGSKEKDLEANVEISNAPDKLEAKQKGSRCAVFAELTVRWRHAQSRLYLSGAAAAALVSTETIRWSELELLPMPGQRTYGEELGATPAMESHLLGFCYSFFLLLGQIFCSVFPEILSQEEFVEENSRCVQMRSPARRSRVEQAWFDLGLIKNDDDGEDVESYVSQVWEERLNGS